jgi:hypothetical protein
MLSTRIGPGSVPSTPRGLVKQNGDEGRQEQPAVSI